jgi:hypothetical protein
VTSIGPDDADDPPADGVDPGADVPDGAAEPRVPATNEPPFEAVLGAPDGVPPPEGRAPGAPDGGGDDDEPDAVRRVPPECVHAVAARRTASAARTGRERVTSILP